MTSRLMNESYGSTWGPEEMRLKERCREQGSRASLSPSSGPNRSRLHLLSFCLPQHSTQKFPCGRARQFVHEDHLAGQLILGDLVFTEFNQLVGGNTLPG